MKIPDDRKPSYEVTINGVKNSFAPGTEVSGDVASALFGTENFPPAPPETDKPFNIPASGSNVSANPTLAGTEDSLTGIEIDGTKYKVVGGSSGGGVLVVTDADGVLDKTGGELMATLTAGKTAVLLNVQESPVGDAANQFFLFSNAPTPVGNQFVFATVGKTGSLVVKTYSAATDSDYPEADS